MVEQLERWSVWPLIEEEGSHPVGKTPPTQPHTLPLILH